MPGTRCAVATCNNSLIKTKESKMSISYHTFPKDEKLRKIWKLACHRGDKNFNPKTSVVCSIHFDPNDFEVDLREQLIGVKTKPKLKPSAYPKKNLKKDELSPSSSSSRVIRANKRLQNKEIKELIEVSEDQKEEKVVDVLTEAPTLEAECLEFKYTSLLKRHELLKRKYSQIRLEFNQQKKQISDLKKDIVQISDNLKKSVANQDQLRTCLNNLFSPSQIDLLLKKKQKVVWKSEDISKSFALRYLSRRCYAYLRNELKYPLPHLSSLKRWAAKLNFRPGILTDVLRIMKVAAITKTALEKVTVLQFDEMKVESTYEYMKPEDEILGPHNQMQVIMARGLFSNWKQPIYLDFDKKMTKHILFEAIRELNTIGYDVVACVSDCGGGNIGLWNELEISFEKTHFTYPITNRNIFFFPDAPHLLKLIRNWLLDTGFILGDDSKINSEPLNKLLQKTSQEITICHRLTQKHLNCRGSERQNVGLAAQLLSHEVATALLHYFTNPDRVAKDVGNFIEMISTWFNIMNSYTPAHSLHVRKPYGKLLEEQNDALSQMYVTFKNMKCCGKNVLQIFQKGVLMSITSLKSLFIDLKNTYSFEYILTHRLNQDSLESFFCQIRSIGGLHDHPSPLSAIYRIRLIVLGKNPGVIQQNQNIQINPDTPREEYIVANVFSQAGVTLTNIDIKAPNDVSIASNSDKETDSDSLSSGSSISKLDNLEEADGFKYLCGWIAKKYKTKYPYMGKYTKDILEEHPYVVPDWLQHLSFGGLTSPSDKWMQQAQILEHYFKKFHKAEFRRGPGIMKKLLKIIKMKITEDIPEEVIKTFIIQRIYIRIKFLKIRTVDNNLKRKSKSDERKAAKKMKKIIN